MEAHVQISTTVCAPDVEDGTERLAMMWQSLASDDSTAWPERREGERDRPSRSSTGAGVQSEGGTDTQLDQTDQVTRARTADENDTLVAFMQMAAAARQEQQEQPMVLPQQHQHQHQHHRHQHQHHHQQRPKPKQQPKSTKEPILTGKPVNRWSTMPAEQPTAIVYSPAAPGQKLFGPKTGVRHKTFGNPQPNEHGHLRLVTHPAGRNVQFNKGVGVEMFEVDGIDGPPREGVIERLEIEVHQVNGAKPDEKSRTEVQKGERFLAATIRDTALPMADKQAGERPSPGLNWWRISGNQFRFIYGESPKNTAGRMDKGVVRCASWQLRYSQVSSQNGKETEVFAHTVPGTFIIRSSCAEIDQRNAECKRAMDSKKEKLIELLKKHGCPERLSLKRPYSTLASYAVRLGLTIDDDTPAKTADEARERPKRSRVTVESPQVAAHPGVTTESPQVLSAGPRVAVAGATHNAVPSPRLPSGVLDKSAREAAGARAGGRVAERRVTPAPVKPADTPLSLLSSAAIPAIRTVATGAGTSGTNAGYSGRLWAL